MKKSRLNGRFGLLPLLIGVSVLGIIGVSWAATLCYTDNSAGATLKGIQQGSGSAGSFSSTNGARSASVTLADGAGRAGLLTANTAGDDAFAVTQNGTGRAGDFRQPTSNATEAVLVVANSSASGLNVQNQGGGPAGFFWQEDTTTMTGRYGVEGYTSGNVHYAVAAVNENGSGGAGLYVNGTTDLVGTVTKPAGYFKIDHPLDPAHKLLYHSFVESPDMKNVYDGVVATDASGLATVNLPSYFDALNRSPRYQLTVIGQFAQAIVQSEESNNSFVIQTSKPNVKVSWQVTGIRQDAYAVAHPIAPEVQKSAAEDGKYLYPTEAGQPASLGIYYAANQLPVGTARAAVQSAVRQAAMVGGRRVVMPPR